MKRVLTTAVGSAFLVALAAVALPSALAAPVERPQVEHREGGCGAVVAEGSAWGGPGINVFYPEHGEWYCWMRLISGPGVDEPVFIPDLTEREDVVCRVWLYPNDRAFMACRNNVTSGDSDLSFRRDLNVP